MSRRPCTFRQRDLTAAVKAVEAAGASVVRVEITENKVLLVLGEPDPDAAKTNPWLTDLEAKR